MSKELASLHEEKGNMDFQIQELDIQRTDLQEQLDALKSDKEISEAEALKYQQELEGMLKLNRIFLRQDFGLWSGFQYWLLLVASTQHSGCGRMLMKLLKPLGVSKIGKLLSTYILSASCWNLMEFTKARDYGPCLIQCLVSMAHAWSHIFCSSTCVLVFLLLQAMQAYVSLRCEKELQRWKRSLAYGSSAWDFVWSWVDERHFRQQNWGWHIL